MQVPKFVVVEVNDPMTLVEYLVTHRYEKFSVVTDLSDHPSFNASSSDRSTPSSTGISSPPQPSKTRASLESIAQALSANLVEDIVEESSLQICSLDPAQLEMALQSYAPQLPYPLVPSEHLPASMLHAFNQALGVASAPSTPGKVKHRWLPANELEESRHIKKYGRVHCKATYKCALCGKPTTLNSTGSRWNLLRHVIMIHSDAKPYKCWDCPFAGIKSNVISHARQCRHRCGEPVDVTTDEMRAEWNVRLHECFPEYVRAKERGWLPEESPEGSPEKELERDFSLD